MATASAVLPSPAAALMSAFALARTRAISTSPSRAASVSGVNQPLPDPPTLGAGPVPPPRRPPPARDLPSLRSGPVPHRCATLEAAPVRGGDVVRSRVDVSAGADEHA